MTISDLEERFYQKLQDVYPDAYKGALVTFYRISRAMVCQLYLPGVSTDFLIEDRQGLWDKDDLLTFLFARDDFQAYVKRNTPEPPMVTYNYLDDAIYQMLTTRYAFDTRKLQVLCERDDLDLITTVTFYGYTHKVYIPNQKVPPDRQAAAKQVMSSATLRDFMQNTIQASFNPGTGAWEEKLRQGIKDRLALLYPNFDQQSLKISFNRDSFSLILYVVKGDQFGQTFFLDASVLNQPIPDLVEILFDKPKWKPFFTSRPVTPTATVNLNRQIDLTLLLHADIKDKWPLLNQNTIITVIQDVKKTTVNVALNNKKRQFTVPEVLSSLDQVTTAGGRITSNPTWAQFFEQFVAGESFRIEFAQIQAVITLLHKDIQARWPWLDADTVILMKWNYDNSRWYFTVAAPTEAELQFYLDSGIRELGNPEYVAAQVVGDPLWSSYFEQMRTPEPVLAAPVRLRRLIRDDL